MNLENRCARIGVRAGHPGEQFLGAPGGMSVARLEDRLHEFGGGGVWAVGGFARSVHQACGSFLYIALHPLIAGETADVVSKAELGEREEVVEVIGDDVARSTSTIFSMRKLLSGSPDLLAQARTPRVRVMMNIHKELPLSFPGLSTLPGPLTPFYTNIATLPMK